MYVYASKHQSIKWYHCVIKVPTDTVFWHQPNPDSANPTPPPPLQDSHNIINRPSWFRWNPMTLVGFSVLLLGNTTWYQM